MRTRITAIGLMAVVLGMGQLAGAQERIPAPPPENPAAAIEVQHKQLGLEQRRAELNFENKMRDIQLDQKHRELNRQQQMMRGPEQRSCPGQCGGHGRHFMMRYLLGLMLFCSVVHILLSVWVYEDIRRRNAGSGIWIVVTLLTGLPGALIYAVVRLGDKSA